MSGSATPVPVLIDRLTSATSPSDASDSLSSLLSQCKKSSSSDDNSVPLAIIESNECLSTLTSLIATSKLSPNGMEVDDGPSLSCELILSLLQSSSKSIPKTLLSTPAEGTLLNALLDALCSPSTSSYTRILSMEILRKLSTVSPHLTQTQLLSAPDGMSRLVDLLLPSTPEEIRNEALLLHTELAKNSGACARLILFGEGYEKSLAIAKTEADNVGGDVVVQDCLKLCLSLTMSDEKGCEVLLGSSECLKALVMLVDLRRGRKFRFPNSEEEKAEEEEGEDDLDALLKAGSSPDKEKKKKEKKMRIPYLTEGETKIQGLVLEILELVIRNNEEDDSEIAQMKQLSHIKKIFTTDLLLRSVVDLALYTHPPPSAAYVSAVPPLPLQHHALNLVSYLAQAAAKLDTSGALQEQLLQTDPLYLRGRVPALDRLMYLVCTGGYGGGDLTPEDCATTSVHALGSFRSALSTQTASLMVLHTLAPPPPLDDDAGGIPPEPPVVQKLVNTLAESSMLLCSETIPSDDIKRVMINMIGAAGALGTFMTNGAGDTTREMLLRVPINLAPLPPKEGEEPSPPPATLMECILQYVEYTSQIPPEGNNNNEIHTLILSSVLRLLSEWVPKSPIVVSALLSSHCSTCFGILLKKSKSNNVQALVGLLLGLCMEHMEENSNKEYDYSGWNREGIMGLITGFGVGKFTSLLENLKKRGGGEGDLPWSVCELEYRTFGVWFGENVNVVRRRMVQELAGNGDDESDEEDEASEKEKDGGSKMARNESFASGSDLGAGGKGGGKTAKTLSKLVSQQSSEIESLREALAKSERIAAKQASELKMWKRRVESNPTQLDEMMNEFTEKNASLESSYDVLKSDMEKMQTENEKAMKEKEDVIEKLQTELKESREREEEARGEVETLREEMEGLSAAYTSLEGEYNRVANGDGGATSAPAAAPTGEGDSAAESPRPPAPAGEVSHQETSSGRGAEQTSSDAQSEDELSNLRRENTKLRNDIIAANEWMSMAVGRMEEMGAQSAALESEVRSLRTAASSQQQADEQQQRRNSVEHADKIQRLRSDLFEARAERDALRTQILLQKEVKGHKREKSEAEKEAIVASKETEIQSIRERMEQAKEDHKQAIDMKDAEIKSLREGMKQLEERISGKESEIQSRDTIIKDMEQRISGKESEIQSRDSTIKDMEQRLSSSSGSTEPSAKTAGESTEEVAKLRKELESYRAANDSAQQWMANAVVHHKTLSKQLQELQEANAKLKADGALGAKDVASVDPDTEKRLEEVTQQLNEAVAEAAALRQESEDYRFEVAQHDAKKEELVMRLEEQEAELKRVRDENSQSHEDLRVRNEELERIRRELDMVRGDSARAMDQSQQRDQTEIKSLKEEIHRLNDKNAKEVASKEAELGLMHDTVQKLQDDSMTLQTDMENKLTLKEEEIKSRDAAIAQFEKQLRDQQFGSLTSNEENAKLKLELASLQSTAESSKEELQRVNDELESARSALLQVQNKLDENEEKKKEIEKELNSKVEEYEALINKNSAHQATIDDLKSKLTDFQSWAENAQQRLAELETEKDAAEQLVDSEKEEKAKVESALQELEKTRTDLQVQLDEMVSKEKDHQAILDEAQNLRSSATELETANKELVDRCENLEMNLQILNAEKTELREKVVRLDAVEEQLLEKEKEISVLQKEFGEAKDQCEQITTELQGRINDLQTKAVEVENENEGLRSEAEQAISEWEARCSFLQGELESVSEMESRLTNEKAALNEQVEELAAGMKELQEVIDELQSQVADKEKAALGAEEQIEALTQELNIINDQSEEVVNQWRERTEELEDTINELGQTIEEQESAANEAIAQWEARCNALSKELEDSEYSIAEKRNLDDQIAALTMKLDSEKELRSGQELEINNLTSFVDSLQVQVDVLTKERDAAVQEKKSIATDLEQSTQDAASKLLNSKNELDALKTRYERLVKDMDKNTQVLNNEKQLKIQLEEALSVEKQSRLEEKKQTETMLKDKETQYQTELEKNLKSISSLESRNRELEEKSASAQKEISTMKETIEHLEEDLSEANSALQSYLTDEVSTRAAEMATHAVRNEISELRLQHASDQEALQAERKARIQAEHQVEKLSDDIAILAPVVEEGESIDSLIRKTASKAADENMKREKHVIKELRSALDRAIEELAIARKSEREAEERAASSRLHASVCEQELMAAKSDIDTLTQSIEEIREAEINTRSSLEYRINALEDDHDSLVRSYTDKMNTLKADLSQTSMEKERLMHALKESEKANKALVYSTSLEYEAESDSPEKSELVMLRMEKVQLLAAVSEASARTERRVREAVATCASSYEADLIVEKELREAAEAMLGDMQAQMEEMDTRNKKTGDNTEDATTEEEKEDTKEEDSNPELELEKLQHDLQSLQVQTKKLQAENQELKKKLKKSEVDSQTSQDKLVQKCRDLEEKVREVEREGHYEAAVAAEIARLRAESANAAKYNSESPQNGDEKSEKIENNMTVEDLYDHVFELKSEIREERMIYRDLLAEHEDLLALLAQQDLERSSLHEALFNVGGEEAVENAIQEAEEKALNQFGKYIKVR